MLTDKQIEREETFVDDWYMTQQTGKTPTYADAIAWADSHPNWIKVEDELPQKTKHDEWSNFVLVLYEKYYESLKTTIRYNEVACYDYNEKQWFKHDEEPIDGVVTHWIPIVNPNRL